MTEQELIELEQRYLLSRSNAIHSLIAEIRSLRNEVTRLQKERADAPIVGGVEMTAMGDTWIRWDQCIIPPINGVNRSGLPTATHTARLVDIQEIKK